MPNSEETPGTTPKGDEAIAAIKGEIGGLAKSFTEYMKTNDERHKKDMGELLGLMNRMGEEEETPSPSKATGEEEGILDDRKLDSMPLSTYHRVVKKLVEGLANDLNQSKTEVKASFASLQSFITAQEEVRQVAGAHTDFWDHQVDMLALSKERPQLTVQEVYDMVKKRKDDVKLNETAIEKKKREDAIKNETERPAGIPHTLREKALVDPTKAGELAYERVFGDGSPETKGK